MITKQKQLFYFVDGKPYASLQEAQRVDLILLMPQWDPGVKENAANWLIENAAAIVDTLTTTPRSRLKARKLHGGKRKSKAPPAPVTA